MLTLPIDLPILELVPTPDLFRHPSAIHGQAHVQDSAEAYGPGACMDPSLPPRRHHAQNLAVVAVGQQVDEPVGPLPNVADAFAQLAEIPLFS